MSRYVFIEFWYEYVSVRIDMLIAKGILKKESEDLPDACDVHFGIS